MVLISSPLNLITKKMNLLCVPTLEKNENDSNAANVFKDLVSCCDFLRLPKFFRYFYTPRLIILFVAAIK